MWKNAPAILDDVAKTKSFLVMNAPYTGVLNREILFWSKQNPYYCEVEHHLTSTCNSIRSNEYRAPV